MNENVVFIKTSTSDREGKMFFSTYLCNVILDVNQEDNDGRITTLEKQIEQIADVFADLLEALYNKNIFTLQDIQNITGDRRNIRLEKNIKELT